MTKENFRAMDGAKFKKIIFAIAYKLEKNKELLNKLNVFPVPDGDTGINMFLTVNGAAEALRKQNNNLKLASLAKIVARATLMKGRGCSGTILSQWFSGFSKICEDKDFLDTESMAVGFKKGFEFAYHALEDPVEGTILTVMRESSQRAVNLAKKEDDLSKLLTAVLEKAKESLAKTPELLPVLKEAGVVDAGAQGYVFMVEAILEELQGKKPKSILKALTFPKIFQKLNLKKEQIINKYCFECVISSDSSNLEEIKNKIKKYGNSLITNKSGELIKIHIHTNYPKKVLKILSGAGEIKESKIDDMKKMKKSYLKIAEKKEIGIVVVVLGKGFEKIFKKMGASVVIRSRKTMNPSVKDFLKAFKKAKANNIIILPNNKNVLITANEAAKMKSFASVVPTKTIPQGIHCLSCFDNKANIESNMERMKKALTEIDSGFVTYAIEDKIYGEKNISKNDFLGFTGKELMSFDKNLNDTAFDLIGKMIKSNSRRVVLYYGKKVQKAEADKLAGLLKTKYLDINVDIYSSGHPYYFYTIVIKK